MIKLLASTIMILALGVSVQSCNKEKKAEKKIEGKWSATSETYIYSNGEQETYSYDGVNSFFTMDFDNCDSEYCVALCNMVEDGETVELDEPMPYRINKDGSAIEFEDDEMVWQIDELTKTKLVVSAEDGGEKGILEFKKE